VVLLLLSVDVVGVLDELFYFSKWINSRTTVGLAKSTMVAVVRSLRSIWTAAEPV